MHACITPGMLSEAAFCEAPKLAGGPEVPSWLQPKPRTSYKYERSVTTPLHIHNASVRNTRVRNQTLIRCRKNAILRLVLGPQDPPNGGFETVRRHNLKFEVMPSHSFKPTVSTYTRRPSQKIVTVRRSRA
jgi:hypothetical protein